MKDGYSNLTRKQAGLYEAIGAELGEDENEGKSLADTVETAARTAEQTIHRLMEKAGVLGSGPRKEGGARGEYTVNGLTTYLTNTEYYDFAVWLTSNLHNFMAHDRDKNGAMSRHELRRALQDYVAFKAGSSPPSKKKRQHRHASSVQAHVDPIRDEDMKDADALFASLDPSNSGKINRVRFHEAIRSPSASSKAYPMRQEERRGRSQSPQEQMTKAQAHRALHRHFMQFAHMNRPSAPGKASPFGEISSKDAVMDLKELTRFATSQGIVPAFIKPHVLKEIFVQAAAYRASSIGGSSKNLA